jgi:hypothetical protein
VFCPLTNHPNYTVRTSSDPLICGRPSSPITPALCVVRCTRSSSSTTNSLRQESLQVAWVVGILYFCTCRMCKCLQSCVCAVAVSSSFVLCIFLFDSRLKSEVRSPESKVPFLLHSIECFFRQKKYILVFANFSDFRYRYLFRLFCPKCCQF